MSRDNSGNDCNNTNTKNCTGSENNNNDNDASATAHTTQAPSSNTTVPAFPVLQRFGLADIDLSKEEDNNRFKRLLGELIAKQQQHSGRRNAIEYIQPSQNVSTTAIAVRSHKSHKAFKTYHQMNPYLGDVVATLDDDKKVGAQRLSDYLAKEHPNEFVEAAKSSGVAVCGVLDKTEGAALFTDAGLKDEQWNTIMRHLRHKFDSKIAVSLKQVKGKCRDGEDIQEQIRKTKRPRGSYKKEEK